MAGRNLRPPGRHADGQHRWHRRGRGCGCSRSAREDAGRRRHHLVDARRAYFDQVLRFLVMGNVTARQPLSVVRRGRARAAGAEVAQAARRARHATSSRTAARPPATTRSASRSRCARSRRSSRCSAKVRDRAFKRPEQLEYLESRGLPVPPFGAAYSVNRGLWGVTIGGKETLVSEGCIPESAWVLTRMPSRPVRPERHTIGFERASRAALDGAALDPVSLIEAGGGDRREVRDRPRHPPGRHDHRLQGAGRLRGPRRRGAAHSRTASSRSWCCRRGRSASRTGRSPALRRPGPRGPAPRPGLPRHRGAARLVPAARHRRGAAAVPPGRRRSSRGRPRPLVSLMKASKGAYGESAGEWTASRRPRLLEDAGAAGDASTRGRAQLSPSVGGDLHADENRRRRQDRLDRAGLRPEATRRASPPGHPLRGWAWCWSSRCSQQVDVQHARADQRPHGQGEAKGDVVVGALGHRQALFGYSGHMPEKVAPGDVVQVLNIGGVLGICDSVNPDLGQPFDCARAGLRAAVPVPRRADRRAGARRRSPARPRNAPLDTHGVPVVALAGTCMERRQDRRGLRDREPHAASRRDGARVQGDRRLAPARHPCDGGRRRAAHPDLHRPRHRLDHGRRRPRR
jgi:argininosuccinate synthase